MFLHEHLVFFLCLNAFVASVSSNNSTGNGSCVQRTVKGHCCKLPFTYKSVTYDACTKKGFIYGAPTYFWCVYEQKNEQYDECKEPIYRFATTVPAIETTTEKTTHLPSSSSSTDIKTSRPHVLVPSTPSPRHVISDEVVYSSPPPARRSTTTVHAESKTGTRSSKTKQMMNIILVCGIGGGIILVMLIASTIIICLKRKNKMGVKDEKDGAEHHELNRMTDQSNNPVYESIDKDLDINSGNVGNKSNNPLYESVDKNLNMNGNDEQQALQPAHVYHELEKPRSSTSYTDDNCLPHAAEMSTSYGPKITPALNDTGSFTHFNELYV